MFLKKAIATTALLTSMGGGVAYASLDTSDFIGSLRPYAGVDLQRRHMGMEQAFGGNIWDRNFNQLDLFGGVRFLEYFGLNAGYEFTERKVRNNVLNVGDTRLGSVLTAGDGILSERGKNKINAWHVDFMGFLPICPRYHVELLGSVGLARAHLKMQEIIYAQNGILANNPVVRNYSEKRTLARASLGVQTIMFDHLGVRLSGTWEDTSRFKNLKPIENRSATTLAKVQDSIIYGLGIFYIY